MAHDGAAVQQVVVTASEKRCWGIIEGGRGSGSELFNQKGGVLKGEIKMFLRFPDGFFFSFPFFLFPLLGFLSFYLCLPSPPPKNVPSLGGNNKNNFVFELGKEKSKETKVRGGFFFFCMLKRMSHSNQSMKIFPDVWKCV